ncbi:MAG: thioredoxin family protein [Leptospiraceae bacterium]|nr:thioredoxin family protein [Leptospiraceae bacterium]
MEVVTELDTLGQLRTLHQILLLYVSGPDCNVCKAVRPKLVELLRDYPQVYACTFDVSSNQSMAAELEAYSIPLLLVFIEGRESIRMARHISLGKLAADLDRYIGLLADA